MFERALSQVALILILSPAVTDAVFACAKCKVMYELRNKNRLVTNSNLTQECGGLQDCFHSAPWGNWGVDVENVSRSDNHQFDGWKPMENGTQFQWNSCTSNQTDFPKGNSEWYNFPAGEFTSQITDTPLEYKENRNLIPMKSYTVGCPEAHHGGCLELSGDGLARSFHAQIFELDPYCPQDDLVTSFLVDVHTNLDCTVDQCTGTTNWVFIASDGISAFWAMTEFSAPLDDTECEEVGEHQ